MQKFGIYIFTSHKNADRCACIDETWGRKAENLFFFTDREVSGREHYIKVTDDDSYVSHVEKNFEAMRFAAGQTDRLDWFLFLGDDNYVFVDNLESFLRDKDPGRPCVYGQVENTWPKDRTLYYPLGGAGHLFSRAGLTMFMEKSPLSLRQWKRTKFSDVAVGQVLRILGMETIHLEKGFYSQPPEFYGITEPEKHVVFHYIKSGSDFIRLFKRELGVGVSRPTGAQAARPSDPG